MVFCEVPSLLVRTVIFPTPLARWVWGGEAAGCCQQVLSPRERRPVRLYEHGQTEVNGTTRGAVGRGAGASWGETQLCLGRGETCQRGSPK